jgi:hypothetical protein
MAGTAGDRDTIKFWTVLAGLILMVSVAVLLIDMSIKAAILAESNALRRAILHMSEECHDSECPGVHYDRSAKASPNGASHDSTSGSSLLDFVPTGMETGDVANGSKAPVRAKRPGGTRPKPGTPRNTGDVPPGA